MSLFVMNKRMSAAFMKFMGRKLSKSDSPGFKIQCVSTSAIESNYNFLLAVPSAADVIVPLMARSSLPPPFT